MNFINPLVLFGLIAAGIPLLLHLLNLRKQNKIEFSTLRFLKELQKSRIKKFKIKQIILLILRTLIIIFAVLAFSRPSIDKSIPMFESYASSSAILLIDNSFSMELSDENGKRFNQAKNNAIKIINEYSDDDEIAIINMSDQKNKSYYKFSKNREFLKNEISKIKLSNSKSDLKKSLKIASQLFDKANNMNIDIYVISDLQKNIFSNDSSLILERPCNLYFLNIGNLKNNFQNISIDTFNLNSAIFYKNKLIETSFVLNNHQDKDINSSSLSLKFNDERVAQRAFNLKGNKKSEYGISAPILESGLIKASIETEHDALDIDNKFHFAFMIPENPKIAIIGDKKSSFLEIAVQAFYNEENYENYIDNYTSNSINMADLSSYDLLFVNAGEYNNSTYSRMQNFTKSGGSIVLFPNPDSNKQFEEFAKNLGLGTIKKTKFNLNTPGRYTEIDKQHPLFEAVFKGETDKNTFVDNAKIKEAYLIENTQAIINTAFGSFLTESKIGDGRVLYFAVPADLSWSNFPLTGLFPTLMQRSIAYMISGNSIVESCYSGQECSVNISRNESGSGNFKIIEPDGNEYLKEAIMLPESALLKFNNLKNPGIYTIINSNDKIVSAIAVNVMAEESQMIFTDLEKIKENLEKNLNEKSNISLVETSKEQNLVQRAKLGTELWQLFLLLALLTALAEMLVAKNTKKEIIEEE